MKDAKLYTRLFWHHYLLWKSQMINWYPVYRICCWVNPEEQQQLRCLVQRHTDIAERTVLNLEILFMVSLAVSVWMQWLHTFSPWKHRIALTYPPRDSDALRGEGFQLHVLRWTIRSWDHQQHAHVIKVYTSNNACLKDYKWVSLWTNILLYL